MKFLVQIDIKRYIKYIMYFAIILLTNSYICFLIFKSSTIIIEANSPSYKSSKISTILFYDRGDGFNFIDTIRDNSKSNRFGDIEFRYRLNDIYKITNIKITPLIKDEFIIDNIYIVCGFYKKRLDLERLYNLDNLSIDKDIKVEYKDNQIIFFLKREASSIKIFKNYYQIVKDLYFNYLIFFILILSIFLFIFLRSRFIKKLINSIIEKSYFFKVISKLKIHKLYIVYLIANIFLILSIFVVKTFVLILAIFYFHYNIAIYDMLFIYPIDILISLLLLIFGFILIFLSKYIQKDFIPFQFGLYFIMLFIVVTLYILGCFYLFSGYIYLEWGAFLEPQNIQGAFTDGIEKFILVLISDIKLYISIFIILLLLYISKNIAYYLDHYRSKKILIFIFTILIFLSSLSYFQFNYIYKSKPITQSPLLMLLSGIDGIIPPTKISLNNLLQDIKIDNFNPIEDNKVLDKYKKFYAKAKDMNLIFFVMESTRAKNLSCYGYKRKTTPYLNTLLSNSIFFKNAIVNNPKTSKTMASLILGVYPEPLSDGITLNYQKIKIDNNLILNFIDKNYSIYFGTTQSNYAGEKFKEFLTKISDNNITLRDPRDFKNNRVKNDERLLTDNFLEYISQKSGKFMGILWTKSAHYPYETQIKKFQVKSDKDKYDNCLINIDNALKNLVDGLKKQDKLDNTLIVILGDHGEGLDDKGECGHGSFLYNHSIKIPFIIYNKRLFSNYIDMSQRFQIKDIASTIYYLFGVDNKLYQSVNIFSKTNRDKIYISNHYQDKKLGIIFNNFKFLYRVEYDMTYLFDLEKDPNENINIISTLTKEKIKKLKIESLKWYKYQMKYLKKKIY